MTNSNVPRQFWIDDDEYNECWYPHACDEKYDDEMIHVIEYSAYESLQAELAEVRAENDLLKTQYQPLVVASKETRAIVEELEAELDATKKQLHEIVEDYNQQSKQLAEVVRDGELMDAKAEKLVESLRITSECYNCQGCRVAAREALKEWQS